jgi:hypothetical protein
VAVAALVEADDPPARGAPHNALGALGGDADARVLRARGRLASLLF